MITQDAPDPYVGQWVFPDGADPLEMVGRKGAHNIEWLANYIGDLLKISPNDEVLDLCCGNGLITRRIASRVRHVTGVDYSRILLSQASAISSAGNIEYLEGDARAIGDLFAANTFDKVYVSAAFQYFDQQSGRAVLKGLSQLLKPGGSLAIMDVPDRAQKLYHHFHAARRLVLPVASSGTRPRFRSVGARFSYLWRNVFRLAGIGRGTSELGWWWHRDEFEALSGKLGFACITLKQPEENPHHMYRFDALLTLQPDHEIDSDAT
jgi:ubiquinone/menaquinone biosynthesis C-methylase UbiE